MKTNKKTEKILYLVDVSSFFFRAYYAISSHLTNKKGLPTNALFGLLSMTEKFIKEKKPEYLVYCFDHEKPSFRVDLYPEYKANRGEAPEDLVVQIPYIKKLVSALNIPWVERAGFEADDLIGSLACRGEKEHFQVMIVSGDKDFAQLVSPSISLYDPMKSTHLDSFGVQQKWGVLPKQMNDYLAIVGDSGDNIPGVRGIGPKGACVLLEQYGSLKDIYKNLKEIPQKTADKLKESKEQAFLSQKLARIKTDINLKKDLPSFKLGEPKTKELTVLLKELNFNLNTDRFFVSSKKKTQNTQQGVTSKVDKSWQTKTTLHVVGNLKVHDLSYEEIKDLIPPYGKVWVFSQNKEWFLSYKNKIVSLKNLDLKKMGQLFSDRRIKWLGYDLKKIWKEFHCFHPVPEWCVMMAVYLIESVPASGFFRAVQNHIGQTLTDNSSPGEVYQAHKKLKKTLEAKLSEWNMVSLYEDIELPLTAVLYEMEQKGILLDSEELKKQKGEVNKQIKLVEKGVFDYVKHEFNISSPKQLADVLFKELNLKPIRKTKTGYSTDMEVLSKLKNQHPVVPLILDHRELFKLRTTYIEALPLLIRKETGRVHTHFRQALTSTGRLSSMNPNLQNIPIRTDRGKKIRRAFIAPEGKKIISADYSQIELRILAHITGDPGLCSAFKKDLDIHKATAGEIYSVPLEKVTEKMRRSAKAINFGLMYGQGPYTLSASLGVSVAEAKEIIKSYFQRFKGVQKYIDSTVQLVREKACVETLMGRRRIIHEATDSSSFHTRRGGERAAINAPIQGTAGDIVKIAMIKLRNSLYSPLLLQIHDELLFECDDSRLEEETKLIKDIMENVVTWKVPLKVNIHVGQNWELAH